MSTENKSIHEFDFSLICEYYSNLERQGPGSPEVTIKALSFIEGLNEQSRIADIGCGTGGQTMVLARQTAGQITGIDLFPGFIDLLNKNAAKHLLQNRIQGLTGSMDKLSFGENELDLIWSEGAIYNIGFEKGLNEWRRFLKPGGYIAVTEVSWLQNEQADEITKFWLDAYPEIDTIPNKLSQMIDAGYQAIAAFVLPEYCWTENFYKPQKQIQIDFLKKHAGNKNAEELVENQRHEALLYEKYKSEYGYVFYIGKKI